LVVQNRLFEFIIKIKYNILFKFVSGTCEGDLAVRCGPGPGERLLAPSPPDHNNNKKKNLFII
jgi:hypothetical protein